MQATAMTTQRGQGEQARMRALVRFNGLTFHSLAAASFLETAVPLHVDRAARALASEPDAGAWLEQIWWPRRAEIGRQLREYIEATWPEFDWNAAYHEFRRSYRPRSGPTGARAVLGLCVTEAQAALFYRALANSADDPALRAVARAAALEHAAFFDAFRSLFERSRGFDRIGFFAAWSIVAATSRCARDHDVAAAFGVLEHNWKNTAILPGFGYPEYRQRMAALIRRHTRLGLIDRLLFRSWLERTPTMQLQEAGEQDRGLPLALRPAAG
jgi:hypothetical protein